MALSFIISKIKRDIGGKSRFFIPNAFVAHVRGGGSPSEYCHNVWYCKTVEWLPDGDTFSRIDRIPVCDKHNI